MVMMKTPKYAATLFAFAVVFLLAAPAVSLADSGQGKQIAPTKMGDKTTPKKAATHGHGTLTTKNPNVGRLKGPAIHESGMGKLAGVEKQGDKSTPKKAPTTGAKPS
jgi:hypothetical protein